MCLGRNRCGGSPGSAIIWISVGNMGMQPVTLKLSLCFCRNWLQKINPLTSKQRRKDVLLSFGRWHPPPGVNEQPHAPDRSDWGGALVKLQQEIELRQYAKSIF